MNTLQDRVYTTLTRSKGDAMSHITQEDAVEIAKLHGLWSFMESPASAEVFANACIKHYIETSVTELTGESYSVPVETDDHCAPNHLCKGLWFVHLPVGEQCDRCGEAT